MLIQSSGLCRVGPSRGLIYQGVANFRVCAVLQCPKPKSDLGTLRKKTGYSLSICKKALSENGNDLKLAEAWLREQAQAQGWAKAQKLQGRNTAQGLLGLRVQENVAAMVELNCETDFVARNKKFTSILEAVANASLTAAAPADIENFTKIDIDSAGVGLLKTEDGGSSIADLIALNIGQIGENMAVGRSSLFFAKPGSGVKLAGLTHPNVGSTRNRLLSGRYATLMAYTMSGEGQLPEGYTEETLANQLCQHIIGMAPTSICNEKDPENSLLHQPFLLDEDIKVEELTKSSGLTILDFLRREVGRTD